MRRRWLVSAVTMILAGCSSSPSSTYCYDPAKDLAYTGAGGVCSGSDRQVSNEEYERRRAAFRERVAAVNAGTAQETPPAAQQAGTPKVYCYDPSTELAYIARSGHCLAMDRQVTEQEYRRYKEAAYVTAVPQTGT